MRSLPSVINCSGMCCRILLRDGPGAFGSRHQRGVRGMADRPHLNAENGQRGRRGKAGDNPDPIGTTPHYDDDCVSLALAGIVAGIQAFDA